MRQKLPTLVEHVLLLSVLGSSTVLCEEQWSRPLSERRSDDWIPIPVEKQLHVRQVDHARDLKISASTVDQIGSLLTPPIAPHSQQSRVLRNPGPQLTGNFFNQQSFKAPPPPPQKSPNQNFFQFTTPQAFALRQQQPQAQAGQPFKNENVNNQFNSFLTQDPNGFQLSSVPNQFVQPQQFLFPQSHFPSPTFFQNQNFGDDAGRVPPPPPPPQPSQAPKANEPTRTSKVRFPEPNSNDDSKEEIQLLYVPVETLQQRGRTPNKLKPNDGGRFKDGPPPSQPNFFPQQVVPQFQGFPPFPQFNQGEFPPIPQFIDDFNVKHRFNKPQDKPNDKPPVFPSQFGPPPSFQQDFPPPKQQKFPQEPPKGQQNFQQQDFSKPPKTVDFAALQQEFALPEKAQPNFQFEFQQPPNAQNFAPGQGFAEPPQNFPPPQQNFPQQQQNFQEQKFNQPAPTTPKNQETSFRQQQDVSPTLNEVAPTKPAFSESSPSQPPANNDAPVNPQNLPGMTLAQFAANEQFFPQFPEQAPEFRPNFDQAPQPQAPQEPQFDRRPPTDFFQPSEQDVFRPSPPVPQQQFQQEFNSEQQFNSGRITPPSGTLPPPHQPPLSVYMENVAKSKVGEVLNLLKSSKTIPVLDNVSKDTPQIFVGPSSLEPPPGYVKFELPYLSSLDTNRIERKVDKLPFFVAPLNFQPPSGYSKIPFPAPHIGSVVVSNATILRAALHEKPFETQGFFEQSTPSPSVYTLPSEINSISPSQVNSLQTTPRFEEQAPVIDETTTQRRTRYRTTTPPTSNYGPSHNQRRPSTGVRTRKPLHRGFPKTPSTTTTTTEIPQEISTEPQYVPEVPSKTHFGSSDQFIEQTVVPAGQQNNQDQPLLNGQNSQSMLDQYFQQQQQQQQPEQPAQQFDVPANQPTSQGAIFNEQPANSEVPQQNQNQDQQFFSQNDQLRQTEATPSVEISSSNYQNILSPSQYHSEVSANAKPENVPEQTPVQQQLNSEPQYQQNEQVNPEQQYLNQNQIDQNNYRPTETRYEQPQPPQPETTVTSYVEINEQETDKPEKYSKTKNKFFEKTHQHKEYVPDQSSILQAHQNLNAFLAQEQLREQEISTTQQTTTTTEEATTKKLRGRVRGRQRYTGRSTTEAPEEQNYPKNFRTQEHSNTETRTSQQYPVYQRTTESAASEEPSSESAKADKYGTFKRRRPLIRPASTSAASSEEDQVSTTTAATRSYTRTRVTKVPTSAPTAGRTASTRTRLRRPGTSTSAPSVSNPSTESTSTETLDWGSYVNSFAPSAGSNEIASPYDDKSITFHNIESHRRNPNYNKVKNDGYWNNGVTVHQSEGVEVNPDTFAPTTESTVAASRSFTKSDGETSATTRGLDRKALYRQRLRTGAVSNDPENVQAQQSLLRRANVHKERIAASKKLQGSQDESTYDANSLQQSEGRQSQRGEEEGQNYEGNTDEKTGDSANSKKANVGRRRGAWVRVRVKKPQDVFETAESQSFAKLTGNALKNAEKTTENTGKDQYIKDVSVDQISLVDTSLTEEQKTEQKPEVVEPEVVAPEVVPQLEIIQETLPVEMKPVSEEPEQEEKDIGEMIRDIINGESEIDYTANRDRAEFETEAAPEAVSEALVATTTPVAVVKNQTTAATTPQAEFAETTVIRRSEQEEVTTYPTTVEAESQATKKVVPTSTTTEISLETEICYKGRCVKSKKTKATDLLPSE